MVYVEMKGVELVEVTTGAPRFATLRSEPLENDDVSGLTKVYPYKF